MGEKVPDEVVGFPTSFMQLGVAGVIATGWAINDAAAFVGVARFFEEWQPNVSPAAALLSAQRWLATKKAADVTEYVHQLLGRSLVAPEDADLACEFINDHWTGRVRQWAAFTFTGM